MNDLEAIIRKHLPVARFDPISGDSTLYHEEFRASGQAKAAHVLSTLKDLQVDLSTSAYLSIGGSYGSEIVWLMEHSDLRRGVLLEYDPNVIPEVMSERARLEKMGKDLHLIAGDATQQADNCRRVVQSLQSEGRIETVVCSAHAVFHELPTRSPHFHLGSFLEKILFGWPRAVFISREPCAPAGWPKRVELSVPELPPKVVEELAREIQRHLRFGGPIRRVGGYVELSDVLAVETLVKLFYAKDLQHELQERLTTIKPTEFAAQLEKQLGASSVSLRYESSKSFEANYRRLKVCARRLKGGQVLPIPMAFCEFVGDSRRAAVVHQPQASAPGMPPHLAGFRQGKKALPAETLPLTSDKPEALFGDEAKARPPRLTQRTGRYLRRRCRVITRGTKQFQMIMHSLLSRRYDRDEAIKRFQESWETLKSPYEQVMTHAAYLETMGNIELMREVIEKPRFTEAAESARMLYEAIACEKLDDIESAQRLLRAILDTEKRRDLLRAAQFNMHVCYEKTADFANVNFVTFLKEGHRGKVWVNSEGRSA